MASIEGCIVSGVSSLSAKEAKCAFATGVLRPDRYIELDIRASRLQVYSLPDLLRWPGSDEQNSDEYSP